MKTAIVGSAILTSVAIVLPVLAQTDYNPSTTGTSSSAVMDAEDASFTTDLNTEADDSTDTTSTGASASVSSETTSVGAETDEDVIDTTSTTGTVSAEEDEDSIPNALPATGGGFGAH